MNENKNFCVIDSVTLCRTNPFFLMMYDRFTQFPTDQELLLQTQHTPNGDRFRYAQNMRPVLYDREVDFQNKLRKKAFVERITDIYVNGVSLRSRMRYDRGGLRTLTLNPYQRLLA